MSYFDTQRGTSLRKVPNSAKICFSSENKLWRSKVLQNLKLMNDKDMEEFAALALAPLPSTPLKQRKPKFKKVGMGSIRKNGCPS